MENYNGITRRNFLIGTAAAGAAALEGCMIGPQLSEEMQKYMDSHDFKAYAILVTQKDHEKDRVQVRGWNKREHLALEGSIEQHSRRLDIPLETILRKAMKTGADFGYATGTDLDTKDKQAEVKSKSFELLSRESKTNLTHYFPGGAVNNELDERVSKKAYESLMDSGELRVVRIVYTATQKKAEKPAEAPKPAPAKPAEKKN